MAFIHKGSRITTFIVLVFSFSSIFQLFGVGIGAWWGLWTIVVALFYIKRDLFIVQDQEKYVWVVWVYFGWNVLSIIRGFFIAENYWESKTLVNSSLIMLLPLSILVTQGKYFGHQFFKSYIKYGIPIFCILYFVMQPGMTGYFLAPISVIILFFRGLSFKWKVILIVLSGFVFFTDLNARSNIIKFLLPYILIIIFSFGMFRKKFFLNSVRLVCMFLPFALIFFYFSRGFNLFNFKKFVSRDYQVETANGKASLLTDTRTGLYIEVINSAIENDYLIAGRSPARGYTSNSFGNTIGKEIGSTKKERYGSEVSILNIVTWTGVVGVLLYFLIFYAGSYLAINASNNIYSKIIGIYLSFRWLYAWVEDFSRFDLFQICLWLLIGICFSKDFRKATDAQFEFWIKSIFSRRLVVFN
jgi:hypothetical protein